MTPLAFAVAAALGNVVGALAVVRHLQRGLRFIDTCLAFGAGFMLAVAVLGVLPEVFRGHSSTAGLYVLLGYLAVHLAQHVLTPALPLRGGDPPAEPVRRSPGAARAHPAHLLRRGGHRQRLPDLGPARRAPLPRGSAAQASRGSDHRERDGGRGREPGPGRGRCRGDRLRHHSRISAHRAGGPAGPVRPGALRRASRSTWPPPTWCPSSRPSEAGSPPWRSSAGPWASS